VLEELLQIQYLYSSCLIRSRGQESRLPKFITLQVRSKTRQYPANLPVSVLSFSTYTSLPSTPSLFALRIFSLYACLYYFFALLLLPLFHSPLCSLIVLGLFSLLFLRLFETRLSAFWVPNNQVSQALSHEGEPMGSSELYVQGLYGERGVGAGKLYCRMGRLCRRVRGSSLPQSTCCDMKGTFSAYFW
jgi:hypothetical protein